MKIILSKPDDEPEIRSFFP